MPTHEQTPKTTAAAIPMGNSLSAKPADQSKVDPAKTEKLHAEIKKNWSKLSDDEVKLHAEKPEEFFGKVKEKHGVSKEDAQKRLTEMKSSCGCGDSKAA